MAVITTFTFVADFGFPNGNEQDLILVTLPLPSVTNISALASAIIIADILDHDPEDILLENITVTIVNIIPGVSFDAQIVAQNNTWGKYNVVLNVLS